MFRIHYCLIYLLLIAFSILGLDHLKYKKKVKDVTSQYDSRNDKTVIELFNLKRMYNLVNESVLYYENNFLDREYDSAFTKKWCQGVTENENDPFKIARAYLHLAKLEYADNNNLLADYNAIRDCSYALDVYFDNECAHLLTQCIIKGYEAEVEQLMEGTAFGNRNLFSIVCNDEEIEFLKILAGSPYENLSLKAHYRLGMIYRLGRSSSLEEKNIQLDLALKHKKSVIDRIGDIQKKYIDVAFVIDNNYAEYAYTMIASILLSSDLDTFYRFHIVIDPEDTLPDSTKQRFDFLKKIGDFSIDFNVFPQSVINSYPLLFNEKNFKPNAHWPRLVMFKLILEQVFTDIDSLIVLDVDMLVHRDLKCLHNQDHWDQYYVAATLDSSQYHAKLFPFYINGGCLVLNLDKMRQGKSIDQFNSVVSDYGIPPLNEQDLINFIFNSTNRLKLISTRWNSPMFHPFQDNDSYNDFRKEDIMPFIRHFCCGKPWNLKYQSKWKNKNCMHPNVAIYWAYRSLVDALEKGAVK